MSPPSNRAPESAHCIWVISGLTWWPSPGSRAPSQQLAVWSVPRGEASLYSRKMREDVHYKVSVLCWTSQRRLSDVNSCTPQNAPTRQTYYLCFLEGDSESHRGEGNSRRFVLPVKGIRSTSLFSPDQTTLPGSKEVKAPWENECVVWASNLLSGSEARLVLRSLGQYRITGYQSQTQGQRDREETSGEDNSEFHSQLAGGKLTISRYLSFLRRKRYILDQQFSTTCNKLRLLIKNSPTLLKC